MTLPYTKNHTIPQCMLKYWVDDTGKYPGVYVYDIQNNRSYKSASRGKKPFSFAIENEMHIVDVSGQRATSVERFLASLESTLCYFLKQAHSRTAIKLDSNEEFKLAMALQSLESRSRYELHKIQQYISQKQQHKSTDTKKLALENFIDYVATMARNFIPLELILVHSSEQSWLLSDRPFCHLADIDHRFVVLTNKVLLAYRKSPTKFRYMHIDSPTVAEINRIVTLQARDWIAGDNDQMVQEHISIFSESSYLKTVNTGGVKEIELLFPIQGWEINE